MSQFNQVGYQRISADSVIGDSGNPIALYGWSLLSGATAGLVIFRNGTSGSGTEVMRDTGTINEEVQFSLGGVGVVFPDGLYVDIDANVTGIAVFYSQLRT